MRTPLVAIVTLLLALPAAAGADHPPERHGYAPVGEGAEATTLHYRLRLPDPARFGPGPHPAVVNYSGYLPAFADDGIERLFLDEGYAFVGLNLAGSGCSGGHYDFFSPTENRLGAEGIEWLARQDWSNGRLAMVNKSYPGISQLFIAGQRPDGLVAIVPGHALSDLYRDVAYPGGIQNFVFTAGFGVPRLVESYVAGPQWSVQRGDQQCLSNQAGHAANVADNPFVQAVAHPFDDAKYQERSPARAARSIEVPTLLVDSWQDQQTGSRSATLVEDLASPWKLIATNGDHDEYFGPDVLPHIMRFLRYHLAQEVPEAERAPGVTYADALAAYAAEPRVLLGMDNGAAGERRFAWTERFDAWPPAQMTPVAYDLHADGSMGPRATPALKGATSYAYLPGAGSQQRGGYSIAGEPAASWSERPPAGSQAVFDSAPLAQDMLLAGSASADLWLSSTQPDTDVQVTLSEIRPDGAETFVQQGWLRASHRKLDPARSTPTRPFQTHRAEDAEPLVPGVASLLRVEIFPFAHMVRAGSRLRLSVEAPHTRHDLWGFAALPLPGRNTLHTRAPRASRLVLPVVPGRPAQAPLPACGTLRHQPCR